MSYNKDQSDCLEAIIPPLLDKIETLEKLKSETEVVNAQARAKMI